MKKNKEIINNNKEELPINYLYWPIFVAEKNTVLFLVINDSKLEEFKKVISINKSGEEKEKFFFDYFQNFILSDNDDYFVYEENSTSTKRSFDSFLIYSKKNNPGVGFYNITEKNNFMNSYRAYINKFNYILIKYFSSDRFKSELFLKTSLNIEKKLLFRDFLKKKVFYFNKSFFNVIKNIEDIDELVKSVNYLGEITEKSISLYKNKFDRFPDYFDELVLKIFSSSRVKNSVVKSIELLTLAVISNSIIWIDFHSDFIIKIIEKINPNYDFTKLKFLKGIFGNESNEKYLFFNATLDKKNLKKIKKNIGSVKLHDYILVSFSEKLNDNENIEFLEKNFHFFKSIVIGYPKKISRNYYFDNFSSSILESSVDYNESTFKLNKVFGEYDNNSLMRDLYITIFLSSLNKYLYAEILNSEKFFDFHNTYIENFLVVNNSFDKSSFNSFIQEVYNLSIKNTENHYWKTFFAKFFPDVYVKYEGTKILELNLKKKYQKLNDRLINYDLVSVDENIYFDNVYLLKYILSETKSIFSYGQNFWYKILSSFRFNRHYYNNLILYNIDSKNVILHNLILVIASLDNYFLKLLVSGKIWLIDSISRDLRKLGIINTYSTNELLLLLNKFSSFNFNHLKLNSDNITENNMRWNLFTLTISNSLTNFNSSIIILHKEIAKSLFVHFSNDKEKSGILAVNYLKAFDEKGIKRNFRILNKLSKYKFNDLVIGKYTNDIEKEKNSVKNYTSLFEELRNLKTKSDVKNWYKKIDKLWFENPILLYRIYEDVSLNFESDSYRNIWETFLNVSKSDKNAYKISKYFINELIQRNYLLFLAVFLNDQKIKEEKIESKLIYSYYKSDEKKYKLSEKIDDIMHNLSLNSLNILFFNLNKYFSEKEKNYSIVMQKIYEYYLDNFISKNKLAINSIGILVSKLSEVKKNEINKTYNQLNKNAVNLFTILVNSNRKIMEKYLDNLITEKKDINSEIVYFLIQLLSDNNMSKIRNLITNELDIFDEIYYLKNQIEKNKILFLSSKKIFNYVYVCSFFDKVEKIFKDFSFSKFDFSSFKLSDDIILELERKNIKDKLGKVDFILAKNKFLFSDTTFINYDDPITFNSLAEKMKRNWRNLSYDSHNWEINNLFDLKILQVIILYKLIKNYFSRDIFVEKIQIVEYLSSHQMNAAALYELFEIIEIKFSLEKLSKDDYDLF